MKLPTNDDITIVDIDPYLGKGLFMNKNIKKTSNNKK